MTPAGGGRKSGAGYRDPRHDGIGESSSSLRTVYGDDTIGDALDKVVAALELLQTAMGSSYDTDYKFQYVYTSHETAELRLNGLTVEVDDASYSDMVGSGEVKACIPFWTITISIRVHTNYANEFNDWIKNRRILMSVSNYLHTYRDLGDNFRFVRVNNLVPKESFSDSSTVGGFMLITLAVPIKYTQHT